MGPELLLKIAYIVVPIITGIGAFFVRSITSRLEKLEEKVEHTVSEEELRITLNDKIEPVREAIVDIKKQLDKVYDLLIKRG
jgi:hypothetical protein